jgi:hypothetical protein
MPTKIACNSLKNQPEIDGPEGVEPPDLLNAIQTLSQLSSGPTQDNRVQT